MPHPFLYLVTALAAGILFHKLCPAVPEIFLIPAGISLLIAWILYFFRKNLLPVFLLILAGTFFLGAGFHAQADIDFSANSLHNLNKDGYLDLSGILIKSPSFGIDNDTLYMKVISIRHSQKKIPMTGKIKITVPRTSHSSRLKQINAGDRIHVAARLINSRGFKNFGQPGRNFYLKMDHVHKQAFCKSPLLVHKLSASPPLALRPHISRLRMHIQSAIEHYFPGPRHNLSRTGAVLEALILGARDRVRDETKEILQHSGLFHLLAISGAHIAVLSLLFFSLLKFMRIPERTVYLIVMALLIFYALLVEGRPSVIRATVVMLFFLGGRLLWRDVQLLNTLSISAFILLILYPFDLFALGFQLTFAATFAIVLFAPAIRSKLPRIPGKFSDVLAVSLAAQIGVLPFIASVFNRISFTSLILNYPALPLVTLIMASGYLFLVTAGLIPGLAAYAAALPDFIIENFIQMAHLSLHTAGLSFRIPDPPIFVAAGYFACLITWALVKKKWGKRFSAAGLVLFALVVIWHPFPYHSPHLKITCIDVGQGDAVLVECPGDKIMLIDGGGLASSRFDVGEQIISQVLWQKGIKEIDYLVCTHPHSDHFLGLISVSRNFSISEFWDAATYADPPEYRAFLNQLSPRIRRRSLYRGNNRQLDHITIDILHPPRHYAHPDLNNHSLVLQLKYGNHTFLFSGDIEKEAERNLVLESSSLSSQVLKIPHHGSDSSSSDPFVKAVAPQIAVVTAGEYNRYGFPDESIIRKYKQSGSRVLRTDLHGAVEIISDGKQLNIRTAAVPEANQTLWTN